jgi:hypothetical protein
MEDAMDDDSLRLHFVNEPVGAYDQLPIAREGEIGIGASALTEFGQRVSRIADSLSECCRERRRISRDVLNRLEQVVGSRIRPDYFPSHFESRRLTSS